MPVPNPGREERPERLKETDGTDDFFSALGKQIQLLRSRAEMTQRELGDRVGYTEHQISSVERGVRTPQPAFLAAVDELLGAGGLLKAAVKDVERAQARARTKHPAWFRDYARLEQEAVELHDYSNQVIPGLLQTEEYARAIFSTRQPLLNEETIEKRVADRLDRQQVFERWPAPTTTFVIEESVLLRSTGGRDVHAAQLEHLLCVGRLRSVELQVMPLDREEHPDMAGPFILVTPKGRQQLAYLEVQHLNRLICDQEEVRVLAAKYGSIRAQALTPRESLVLIEKMLGER